MGSTSNEDQERNPLDRLRGNLKTWSNTSRCSYLRPNSHSQSHNHRHQHPHLNPRSSENCCSYCSIGEHKFPENYVTQPGSTIDFAENHFNLNVININSECDSSHRSKQVKSCSGIEIIRNKFYSTRPEMLPLSNCLPRRGRSWLLCKEKECPSSRSFSSDVLQLDSMDDLEHSNGNLLIDQYLSSPVTNPPSQQSHQHLMSHLLSSFPVILNSRNFKMFTLLLQLILIPLIIAIVLPPCGASKTFNSSQSESPLLFSNSPLATTSSKEDVIGSNTQIPKTHHRFDMNRSGSQELGATKPADFQDEAPHSNQDSRSHEHPGWDPTHRIKNEKKFNTIINNNDREGSIRNDATVTPSSSQRNGWKIAKFPAGDRLPNGVPFGRVHSTGFLSLGNGNDESAKRASSAGGLLDGESLIMLTPQLVGLAGSEDASSRLLKVGPCLCWNTTDDGQSREVECKCTGPEMTSVTSSLPSDIHRLTVEQAANFTTLGNEDLKPYGGSLTELVLSELPSFQTFRNGTFLGMKRLNTIYIHGTPSMTQIPDAVLTVYLPELKLIRITHSSLEVVPNFSQLHIKKDAALHMVELENNKISRIIPGSFKGLVTEHLALSYNDLEEIGPSAFEGSTIARLALKGNPLKTLHSTSFVGIDSLRVLDLSETQITYLPTQGLIGLESLRLQKVWTLRVIPSIYHFQNLEEASLTWPYHCCAFEFPETHDPAAFQKYQEYVRSVIDKRCAKASENTSSSTEHPETASDKNENDDKGFIGSNVGSNDEMTPSNTAQRQKRHLRVPNKYNVNHKGYYGSSGGVPYGGRNFASSPSTSPTKSRVMDGANGNTGGERDMSYWNNENPQVNPSKNVYVTQQFTTSNGKVLSKRVIINEPLVTSTIATSNLPRSSMVSSSSSSRLRKRSLTGHHPRLALAQHRNGLNGSSSGITEGSIKTDRMEDGKQAGDAVLWDGFHHPHVHGGGSANVNMGNGNSPSHHPFDDGDESTLRYDKIGPGDAFDPFVFDPDQSFAPIEPRNEFERESDIRGKVPWGMFGHSSEAEFNEDIGIFHPSVTPSPTVITLCGNVTVRKPPKVTCHPLPDAFNPCEDIMGSIWLRGAVWVVVALALFGNTAVLVVLLLAPGRISVQRFLMANLSWADLCMGVYHLMVATQDLVSLGSYFNYAIDWQLGWGCQIAGFLTVFASELSVFTLAVITGERWYALTRAIHLTKRLTLLGAAQLMAFGWFMAILLAALPLMGVSSYSKTSICLPMEASSGGAVAYLVFLLLFNGIAFFLVACAYWQMYRAVAGHGRSDSPASSADTAIAKKMALLVFTDFACWAPVAFFGLTAVGGFPLIGVTDSKILLVFFYPLNACCNPYLYAILTKQYRRDLLLLLSRHGMCTKRAARYKTGAASTNNTMQTMQTVLRMGSMTETKVAGGSGSGRGSLLNGGRSIAGPSTILEDETLLVSSGDQKGKTRSHTNGGGSLSPGIPSSCSSSPNRFSKNNFHQLETNILNHPADSILKSSSEDLRKALNLQPPSPDEDDDDVFDLNGLSGRHIAETTFINVPLNNSMTGGGGGGSGIGKVVNNSDPAKEKLIRGSEQYNTKVGEKVNSTTTNNSMKLNNKDEHDLDNEITETTPFCSVRN